MYTYIYIYREISKCGGGIVLFGMPKICSLFILFVLFV